MSDIALYSIQAGNDSFRYFEPVEFFENKSDLVVFWGFSDSTGREDYE